jgi:hypothetical protein
MASIIKNIQACNAKEIESQIQYLKSTPVSHIAGELRRNKLSLSKGIIDSVAILGSLQTIFGKLGTLSPANGAPRNRFLVSEIFPLLTGHPKADPVTLQSLVGLMRSDAIGRVEYRVTILRRDDDLTIIDGNKRTVAYYERRKADTRQISYPVFVVHQNQAGDFWTN